MIKCCGFIRRLKQGANKGLQTMAFTENYWSNTLSACFNRKNKRKDFHAIDLREIHRIEPRTSGLFW